MTELPLTPERVWLQIQRQTAAEINDQGKAT
jgi:hypothetical protein